MTFSLSILLYVYYLFVAIWLIFGLVAVYHMLRFGLKSFTTFFMTFLFIVGALIIFYYSYLYIGSIDWEFNMTIFNNYFQSQKLF